MRTFKRPSQRVFGWVLWAALGCFLLQGAVPGSAAAQPQSTEVLTILASSEPGEIAAELREIEALRKPPFNGFKSMKVLNKATMALAKGKPTTTGLPNGRQVQIELLEELPGERFKVNVAINKPGTKDYLPGMVVIASRGEPFFVAGQQHKGGTLVIGVRVGKKKP